MNISDDEAPAAADGFTGKEVQAGKRKIGEVDPKPRPPSGFRYLTSSCAQLDDSFADSTKAFSLDKFGALIKRAGGRKPEVTPNVQTTAVSSTGSFAPSEHRRTEEGGEQYQGTDAVNDSCSTWSKYIDLDWKNEGTSYRSSSNNNAGIESDLSSSSSSSHTSVPISCTLHEGRSTSRGCPTLQQFCAAQPQQDVDKSHEAPEFPQNELEIDAEPLNESELGVNVGSLLTALSRHSFDHCNRTLAPTAPTVLLRFSSNTTEGPSGSLLAPDRGASRRSSQHCNEEVATLDNPPRFAYMGSHSRQSADQYPVLINYRFASANLEASLLQRMEERQRVQDEAEGEERVCSHVISPEDLIWGNVKHYCGMVLDRETGALLGTAILFIPPDHQTPARQQAGTTSSRPAAAAAAWVTCVKVVEGRTEVLIKTSKGNIHVAQLLLTSTTLGLALFSVHVWQGTFALAFLSRVAGPASLPHRPFVDAVRSDRVYVTGYEEPWESEAGTIADVRVRPGRIVDAGRHEVVEIDFTAGRLGGSIHTPAGFRGGLVVRADGRLVGVVTGEVLGDSHPTNIDFSSAHNVYSLLEEL